MYKVIDSANNVHWIEAEEYHYEPATIEIISFTRDGNKVASFKNPISIELVTEEKKSSTVVKEKEFVYVPYHIYPTYQPVITTFTPYKSLEITCSESTGYLKW